MIFNFIGDYHRLLSDKDKKYLYCSLDIADPFAYFCITWQRYTRNHAGKYNPSFQSVAAIITYGLG
jgi:hypothetical protein